MDSPLVRVILALLGGYLIILLCLSAYDWIAKEYPRPPDEAPNTARIQHPFDHPTAVDALRQFGRLPQAEKAAMINSLNAGLISVPQWRNRLRALNLEILCLGELHEESTRTFLAKNFFAQMELDRLLLETTPGNLKGLIKRMNDGRDYFPLLNADILNVLRAAKSMNPDLYIGGVEETEQQGNQKTGIANTRDRSIAQNFWDRFQPGESHIILFGALHCANESNWLFNNLYNQASAPLKDRMLNARVLGEHQDGPLEAFVYFLDEIGVKKKDFVILSADALHSKIHTLFPFLRQTLDKYACLIVFRQ